MVGCESVDVHTELVDKISFKNVDHHLISYHNPLVHTRLNLHNIMADGDNDVSAIVCDNGSGAVKVRCTMWLGWGLGRWICR